MKQITLKITPTGSIEAETHGIKGKGCLDYISILEQLTGACTVDSAFTAEYKEAPVYLTMDEEVQVGR